jgi:beta-glucosidase
MRLHPRVPRALIHTAIALAAVCAAAPLTSPTATTVRAATGACAAWMDPAAAPATRAQALLAAMTQADKIALTQAPAQYASIGWAHYGVAGYIPSPDTSLCIPDLVLNDAGQGVGDFMTGTTAFPAPISQAASWDPAAQQTFGAALGAQAFSKGVNIQLAPGIETDRVPMNGRNWEYMSEDPFLSGQTAAAVVRGIQSQNVIATVKHYVANSQETNRNTNSSDIDERALHELYLPQYQAAITQGGAGAVMCSYNRINSVYACENPDTLTTALRTQMGFTGFVMSDWGATHSTAHSANSGLDMEMGSGTYFGAALQTAIDNGQVSEATLNQMVLHILVPMFAHGLFDHPVAMGTAAQAQAAATPTDTPAQNTLSGQVARNGMVLLKNQGGVLPLASPASTIAVIGGPATAPDALYTYNGGGSGHIPEAGYKPNVITPLMGMQTLAATRTDVVIHANGNGPQFADAVAAAKAASVAVVFAYSPSTEGVDQGSGLALPPEGTHCELIGCTAGSGYNQDALISAVAAANPNTVVVLETGGPVLMPWLSQVKGVVEAWYPGQDEGDAIASVLFGDTNPSGHLPETFPASLADLPTTTTAQYPGVSRAGDSVGTHSAYSEGLNVGYRWYDDMNITPLFPFGFGLSYTTFSYSNYALSAPTTAGGPASVSFDVTNTGAVAGATVPQVYVGSPADNYVNEPLHQLRGYRKVTLQPGGTAHVIIPLDPTSVEYWDTASSRWVPETGCHPVWVGGSSRDIRLQGSGLNGSMQVVASCAASLSTYIVNTPQVAESPAVPLLFAVPAGLAVIATRRLRRRAHRATVA